MSLPDEIIIDEDDPNAGDFVYVSGRCYERTTDKDESYEVTHTNIFPGMLDEESVTVHAPKETPTQANTTRIDVISKKFESCGTCSAYGDRYRGQGKITGKDFKIKVIKEIDSDNGNEDRYKLNGEDRNGTFNLETNRNILIFENDTITFDTGSLGDQFASFTIPSSGATVVQTNSTTKLVLGYLHDVMKV